MNRLCVAALAALALTTGAAQADWTPSDPVKRALEGGAAWSEVRPSAQGAHEIRAAVDIDASPTVVWAVMNDCKVAPRIITSLTRCAIIDGDMQKGWDVREQVTRGNLFVPTLRNRVRGDYEPYRHIRFHRVDGDLRIEEGEWRLEPLKGGAATRLTYRNRVAVAVLAPAFIVREGLKRDTAKVMTNLRRECLLAKAAAP